MARKSDQLMSELDDLRNHRVVRVEAGLREQLRADAAAVPPRHALGQPVDLVERKAQRLAQVAQGAAWPIGVQRGSQRRAVPAVFRVDILHHLFAPLMFEIDVDVRRLVALAADKAFK